MNDTTGSPYLAVPQGAQQITTLKTKIVEAMDYVLRCDDDRKALNGWRQLCAYGWGLISIAEAKRVFDNFSPETYEDIKRLRQEYSEIVLWKIEKTQSHAKDVGEKTYELSWDSYVRESYAEDLMINQQILDSEKYNQVCHRLAQFWGDCFRITMLAGCVDSSFGFHLDDKIAIPVKPEERYTEQKLADDMQKRRLPIRPTRPQPQSLR